MTDEGVIATARCRCGATVAWVRDLEASAKYERGTFGQPYTDGSWMIHTEPPIGGQHVPIRVDEWTFGRLTELIVALYKIHAVGGPLHSVLDDGNLDGTIEPYYDCYDDEELDELWYDGIRIAELHPKAPAVTEGLGRSMRQLCDEIAALLNAMPEDQRYEAVERAQQLIT